MALKADAHRHKDGRRTARALFVQIRAQGYRGGYSAVTDFIRAWRSDLGKATKAFVPLVFDNGEAFQFDWSEEGMLVGGVFHKVQAAHLKLCASCAFWLVAYPTQSHEMLFDAHTRSFAALVCSALTLVMEWGRPSTCAAKGAFPSHWNADSMMTLQRLKWLTRPSEMHWHIWV